MTGRWLARIVCVVLGHGETYWHVRAKGNGWECSRCLQFTPSPVLPQPKRKAA